MRNKHTCLIAFLLGVLLTLLLFGIDLPLLEKFKINFTVHGSLADWITAIATLLAVISALSISIWGKTLNKLFYMSKMVVERSFENIQPYVQVKQGQTRLLFKNIGNYPAEKVEVYVSRIIDGSNERSGFLPVPLSWTHSGKSRRDFHPNQYGYLDLCRIDNIDDHTINPKLVLAAGGGVDLYQRIDHGMTILFLDIFQKSGEAIKYRLHLNWLRGENYVVVDQIVKVA